MTERDDKVAERTIPSLAGRVWCGTAAIGTPPQETTCALAERDGRLVSFWLDCEDGFSWVQSAENGPIFAALLRERNEALMRSDKSIFHPWTTTEALQARVDRAKRAHAEGILGSEEEDARVHLRGGNLVLLLDSGADAVVSWGKSRELAEQILYTSLHCGACLYCGEDRDDSIHEPDAVTGHPWQPCCLPLAAHAKVGEEGFACGGWLPMPTTSPAELDPGREALAREGTEGPDFEGLLREARAYLEKRAETNRYAMACAEEEDDGSERLLLRIDAIIGEGRDEPPGAPFDAASKLRVWARPIAHGNTTDARRIAPNAGAFLALLREAAPADYAAVVAAVLGPVTEALAAVRAAARPT